jgi:hypothetical protein
MMARIPEYMLVDGEGAYEPQLDIIYAPTINEVTTTSVSIDVQIINMGITPTSYRVIYQKLLDDGVTNDGSPVTITSVSKPILVTGLTAGKYYKFTITALNGSQAGTSVIYSQYKMSTVGNGTGIIAAGLDPKKITPGKSYYVISNNSKSGREYTISYRTFPAISLTAESLQAITGPDGVTDYVRQYGTGYYSFGTSIIMDSIDTAPQQGAGLGFFVSNNGGTGYYILIESTASSAVASRKSVRVIKVNGKDVKVLSDSQRNTESTFEGVYGGRSYTIDAKVKVSGNDVTIIVYVNGFKIVATDKNEYQLAKGLQQILKPTQTVALLCSKGTAAFDYIYGNRITQAKYDDSNYLVNIYQGQFSNDILNTSFGEIAYDGNFEADEVDRKGVALDEFGTVVREIVRVNTKFDSRPAYPIKWSTGDNKYAKVLGYKISNFGGEAYVLNNTSTTIPLADGDVSNFYIFGNSLGLSGTLEYTTSDASEYATKEPAIFESKWLQSESDVMKLAQWIKEKVINRGKMITMNVFGNPLISVGDIVTIKYTYQGLVGTEKFIVTNVDHTYDNGLETSIVCRTL